MNLTRKEAVDLINLMTTTMAATCDSVYNDDGTLSELGEKLERIQSPTLVYKIGVQDFFDNLVTRIKSKIESSLGDKN